MYRATKILCKVLFEHCGFSKVQLIQGFTQAIKVLFGIPIKFTIFFRRDDHLEQICREILVSVSYESWDIEGNLCLQLWLILYQYLVNLN